MRITTILFIIPNNVACYNRFYHMFTENSIPAVYAIAFSALSANAR